MKQATVTQIEKIWLSNKEAQAYLGVGMDFLKNLRSSGVLGSVQEVARRRKRPGVYVSGFRIPTGRVLLRVVHISGSLRGYTSNKANELGQTSRFC